MNREKKIKLLKTLSDQQLADELKRRRGLNSDYKLIWIHENALHEGLKKAAERSKEQENKENISLKEQKSDEQ
ncbi:MAG: hypothetical protein MRERV_3c105 [Mycoplasmataceae bacterium RV_VA103A]|nr:MAG: hypothetical protein MRERV_3c105 [Mycoplasmataceae bacterium RV_VA103A]